MADVTPSASYSVTLRLEIRNQPGMLGKVTSEIGLLGGDLGAIDIVSVGKGVLVRDVTVNCRDIKHAQSLIDGINQIEGVKLLHQSDRTFLMHLGGKIEVNSRAPIRDSSATWRNRSGKIFSVITEFPSARHRSDISCA